jgi:hypothetical protein
MDEFEQFLKNQPVRTIPPEWRTEILGAAKPNLRHSGTQASGTPSLLREWLWPSPVAWAGLACVWLVIFALNFASRPTAQEREMASRLPSRSPQEIAAVLAQQQRELAQLLAPPPVSPVAIRQPDPPGPRSEIPFAVTEV